MNNNNSRKIVILVTVFFINMHMLIAQQVDYIFKSEEIPLTFCKVDDNLIIEGLFNQSIPDLEENRDINMAISGFKELSLRASIGLKLTPKEEFEIYILSNIEAYTKSIFLSNINSMRLSFSEDFKNALNSHGMLISTVDLSTSDATTEQINYLLNGTHKIHTLIMPFAASYKISEIHFPPSLKKIVIYNQSISKNNFISILKSNSISELVFWGCVLHDDASDFENIISNSLKSITLLNCNFELHQLISKIKFTVLEKFTTDDIYTLSHLISNNNVQVIKVFTHRVRSTNKTGQARRLYIQEVVNRLIIAKRDETANKLTVVVSSID